MQETPFHPDPGRRLAQFAQDSSEQRSLQSDAELLELYLQGGQPEALEAIIRRYAPMVASVCSLTVADPNTAEDAFQATFLVLIKSAGRIRNHASLGAWLHGVAYRTASRLRKQKSKAWRTQSGSPEVNEQTQSDSDPVAQVARKMELDALDRELENLPERLRIPLVEHYLLGHSAPTIAERLDLTTAAVEGRLKRGRRRLRVLLARRGISLSVLVAGSELFRQHLRAAECSDWTNHFIAQQLSGATTNHSSPTASSPAEAQALPRTISSPGSLQVSQLVSKELSMFGKNLPAFQAAFAASLILLCGTLGVLASFPQETGSPMGQSGINGLDSAKSPAGEVVLEPLPVSQRNTSAFTPAPTGPRMADVDPLNPPPPMATDPQLETNLAQFGSGPGGLSSMETDGYGTGQAASNPSISVVPWQRPEGTESGEPNWLAGGRASTDAIERNRQVLAERVEFDFSAIPLREVVLWLNEQVDAQFELNVHELDLLGIDPDEPISVSGEGSVRELIRRAVEPLELTYRITESTIEITSIDAASENQNMRFYDLSYILPNSAYASEIITAIEHSIKPDSWTSTGGQSSISMVGSTMIVNAPDTTHQSIEVLLLNLSQMNPRNTEQPIQPAGGLGGGLGGGGGGGMF